MLVNFDQMFIIENMIVFGLLNRGFLVFILQEMVFVEVVFFFEEEFKVREIFLVNLVKIFLGDLENKKERGKKL